MTRNEMKDTNLQVALRKLGITIDEMWEMTNKCEVLDIDFTSVARKESNIHGYGMFAKKNIHDEEFVGIAFVDGRYKTSIGRYTNHANNPNVKFLYIDNKNIIAVAVENIKEGEELFVDYSSHTLNPEFL